MLSKAMADNEHAQFEAHSEEQKPVLVFPLSGSKNCTAFSS